MLSKYSGSRSFSDNLKLAILTAIPAGMVNVAAYILFVSFASNVTGHYAVLAFEIVDGNTYLVAIVFAWIFAFFFGAFTSNFIVIHFTEKNQYMAHATPIIIEIICLMAVAFYGEYFHEETLIEMEVLLTLMLFSMGLQNGLTASISNFAVKTTHLTGATTDLGILYSMFSKKKFREDKAMKQKAILISCVAFFYLSAGVLGGFLYYSIGYRMFYVVCAILVLVITYDLNKAWLQARKKRKAEKLIE